MTVKFIAILILVVIILIVLYWRMTSSKTATTTPTTTTTTTTPTTTTTTTPTTSLPTTNGSGGSVSGTGTMFFNDSTAELYPGKSYTGWTTGSDRSTGTIAASDSEARRITLCQRVANQGKTWTYRSIMTRETSPPRYLLFQVYYGGGNTRYFVRKLGGGIPDLEAFFQSFPYNYFWYDNYEYWDSKWSVGVVSEPTYRNYLAQGAVEL